VAWTAVKGIFSTVWDGLKTAARNGVDRLGELILKLHNTFLSTLRSLPGKAISLGRDNIGGLIGGIRARASEVYNLLRDLAKNALKSAKDALGISSPSREFMKVGKDTAGGYIKGLSAMARARAAGTRPLTERRLRPPNPRRQDRRARTPQRRAQAPERVRGRPRVAGRRSRRAAPRRLESDGLASDGRLSFDGSSRNVMYFVYMVQCSDGTFYTGITTDIQRRITEHNTSPKGAKYTRARRPVTLVYTKKFRSRVTASRAEARIKSLSRAEKVQLVASTR
jgi:putative endonuclease